ncbi:hypothetical protein N9A94_02200 [Akkermansiaceae bacterium]|nr:hypothetical protein [Akkermansiaceae bacterium]
MMKALREGEREREATGEVVTRADGSVVRKVKRRKRRTDQPEGAKDKPAKKKKRLLWKLVVGVSLVLFAVLGSLFTLVGYNSKAYREKCEERASSWTGSEVKLNGLKLMPGSVSMTDATFQWPKTSYLRDLNLRRVTGHADITSFLWARLGGRELGGKVGVLNFQLPGEQGSVGQNLDEPDFPFGFQGYYCDALDIYFGKESPFSVKGTDSSFRYINGAGFRLTLDQGMLSLDGWEDLPINNGVFKFSPDQVNMETLILGEPGAGGVGGSSTIKLSGLIPLAAGEKIQMDLVSSRFAMEHLFGEQMGKLASGQAGQVEGKVNYTMGKSTYDDVSFTFAAPEFRLHKFPFLINLDKMFPQEVYSEIVFDNEISGTFRKDSRGVMIENLRMSQKDILILRGNILISNSGRIVGTMSLSINNGLITSHPKVQNLPAFAGKGKNAFHKIQFELGGTLEEPNDNFSSVTGLIQSDVTTDDSKLPTLDEQWKKLLEEGE